ncbi:MAG: AAA family ATPase [Deltaproteobacteria bacterium]|nr:AAA family ATPase [Deltaproteobacteria bacterium]
MNTVQQLRLELEQKKGKRAQIQSDLETCASELKELKRYLRRCERAREIIRQVGLKTQQQLEFHISDIVTMALEAVFPDPYLFKAEFIQRRNKTECDLWFVRDEDKVDPISSTGGGVIDIASFALRIASWSIQHPRSRAVLFLDEPFKHLSIELLPKAAQVMKQLSEQLNLQVIMVTHSEELAEAADKTFLTSIAKGESTVKEVDT